MDLRTADITVGELAKLYERIAALEAELAAAQAAHAKSHEEAADWRRLHTELLAELAPWRRMVAQMRGFEWQASSINPDGTGVWVQLDGEFVDGMGEADTLPAAVAAACEQLGVGDE